MATAQNIIDAAFRKIGHSDPTPTDRTEALENLNNMISSWGGDYLNHYYVRESLALTAGDAEYTVGSGGDLNTVRPIALEDCYLRNSDGDDYPVTVRGNIDYNAIGDKDWEGRPEVVYFVPEYPLAKVIFECEPDETYTAYFDFKKNFTEFATLATTVSLPNEFKEALVYNLAISLAEDKGIALPQSVHSTAKETKYILDRLNATNRQIPIARFDFNGHSAFDITTGD